MSKEYADMLMVRGSVLADRAQRVTSQDARDALMAAADEWAAAAFEMERLGKIEEAVQSAIADLELSACGSHYLVERSRIEAVRAVLDRNHND